MVAVLSVDTMSGRRESGSRPSNCRIRIRWPRRAHNASSLG